MERYAKLEKASTRGGSQRGVAALHGLPQRGELRCGPPGFACAPFACGGVWRGARHARAVCGSPICSPAAAESSCR